MAKSDIAEVAHSSAGQGGTYLSLVDGLRGFAAFAVLLYHYIHFFMAGSNRKAPDGSVELFPAYNVFWPIYDYGYFAVQVFWMISGFVFAHVYCQRRTTTRGFAISRFARLYPLHLLTLLIVVLLQFIALNRLGYTPIYSNYDLNHFIAQLFMASDWISQEHGYAFNGPIWSVSVEIVIYALFWITCPLMMRGRPILALAIALGLYFLEAHFGEYSKVFVCGFYFFLGCGLALLHSSSWGRGGKLAAIIAPLVMLGMVSLSDGSDWAWRYLALPGLFGAAILLLAAAEGQAPPLLRRGCHWLGESTYGIYLWHFPIQLALLLCLMPVADPASIARSGWFLAFFVALVLVVARISNSMFERPVGEWLRRVLRPRSSGQAAAGQKEGDIVSAAR